MVYEKKEEVILLRDYSGYCDKKDGQGPQQSDVIYLGQKDTNKK